MVKLGIEAPPDVHLRVRVEVRPLEQGDLEQEPLRDISVVVERTADAEVDADAESSAVAAGARPASPFIEDDRSDQPPEGDGDDFDERDVVVSDESELPRACLFWRSADDTD